MSPQAKTSRLEPTFDFLRLPGELRNKIYKMVLKFEPNVSLTRTTPSRKLPGNQSRVDLSTLLSLNRQINTEATGILYQENTIKVQFDQWNGIVFNFSQAISPRAIPTLRRLKLVYLCNNSKWAYKFWRVAPYIDFIQKCPRLCSFEVAMQPVQQEWRWTKWGKWTDPMISSGKEEMLHRLKDLEPVVMQELSLTSRSFRIEFRKRMSGKDAEV